MPRVLDTTGESRGALSAADDYRGLHPRGMCPGAAGGLAGARRGAQEARVTTRTCPLTASEATPGLRVLHAKGQWWGTITRVQWPIVWVLYAMDADHVAIGQAVAVPGAMLKRVLRQETP